MPFPLVTWSDDQATFVATGDTAEFSALSPTPAVLVFPFEGDKIVLAQIKNRGWCIPGGHLEPSETLEEAIHREAHEEAGIVLENLRPIGAFLLTAKGARRYIPTFIANVGEWKQIPQGSESDGRIVVTLDEVAACYFMWDELLSAVFNYASEQNALS